MPPKAGTEGGTGTGTGTSGWSGVAEAQESDPLTVLPDTQKQRPSNLALCGGANGCPIPCWFVWPQANPPSKKIQRMGWNWLHYMTAGRR
mmetsp:Transcript_96638/g.166578  ORF Transcript_96638/g.166578 Transcript_96638/m.166578 type:complete len:90 (-) Transcript_96638:789-1058(-)